MDSKRPSYVPSPQDLSGQIFRARIRKSRLDHCDLDLLAPDDGRIVAHGRLYQSESVVNQDVRLLGDISRYKQGEVLEAVFVSHSRQEQGQVLWYVHERWAIHNPWPQLVLREDDIVTGRVIRPIRGGNREIPVGYLIQLTSGEPIQSCLSAFRPGLADRTQPDIEVFLPAEDIPWADGSLTALPSAATRKGGRMNLEIGSPVKALVRAIRVPPENPTVSLVGLINHLDAHAGRDFNQQTTLALWRFRRLLGSQTPVGQTRDEAEFPPGHMPYQGKCILLVDNDPEALTAQSELLELMGASVQSVLVKPGDLRGAIQEVVAVLREQTFDLALVDNNLPGRDVGQALVEKVRAQLGSHIATRFVLLTANAVHGLDDSARATLKAKGLDGMVQRPLTHSNLQRLLAGETIWEEGMAPTQNSQAAPLKPGSGATNIHTTLNAILQRKGISFVMLFKALRHLRSRDLLAVGAAPFGQGDYDEVLARTDLHLLVEDRVRQLDILAQEGGNDLILGNTNARAHWRTVESGGSRWILGVGYGPELDIAGEVPVWHAAIAAALEAQSWREWAEHVSGFVQLGLAHQGLSHEVFNMQDELNNLLWSLRRSLGKLRPNGLVDDETCKDLDSRVAAIEKASSDLLEFAKHQLRGQSLRHRLVYLPEAVKAIKRIVDTECQEAEVAFHAADAPPLALPLPNAALVLPVVNLLVNAAKHHYRQENRRVELSVDLEELAGRQFLVVNVRDNGPGLSQAVLERLWQPGFSQATDSGKRHGIGLWLSRQLVEEAGGTLSLQENWLGLGAWFRLRYPIHLG
jgi:signal transduction histidine kinase